MEKITALLIILLVLMELVTLFTVIWATHVDAKLNDIDKKVEKLGCLIRHLSDKPEEEEYKPSPQMIAEGDCDGVCKNCEGKYMCWKRLIREDGENE